MSYTTIKSLPQLKQYTLRGQRAGMKAFQDAYKHFGEKNMSLDIAHAAAHQADVNAVKPPMIRKMP